MIQYIDNSNDNNLKIKLTEVIPLFKKAIIVSPFLSSTDILFNILEQYSEIILITRLSPPATPDLFKKLHEYNNLKVYVYDDDSLHSKIYHLCNQNENITIIGSSNMTNGGLHSNKEFNIAVKNIDYNINEYFKYLIANAYSELNSSVIEYYKTIYKKPEKTNRFKRIKLDNKIINEYTNVLNKYLSIKGVIEIYNNTDLPFTYLYDSFAHQFKTKIIKDYDFKSKKLNKNDLIKYFKIFLEKYFDNEDLEWRKNKFINNMEIKNQYNDLGKEIIHNFIQGLHCVSFGSGSGVRKRELSKTNVNEFKKAIDFILNERIEMPQKIAILLTDKKKGGLKIDYLGKSSIQEIPGWLLPDNYPIINEKFKYVLNYFEI